ncbi:hypothetical protein NE237_029567 [Protea cynaroides]|uniref:Disease resistance N-terminal domain-containing protein n=1 Tax=Protea cynaroides TaxID=273540 RepID=A0A9Q0GUI2_9MAGN|nr:hypothetical protein NE237_029567 [Protea cynaroides]
MLDKLSSPLLREFGSEWGIGRNLQGLCDTLERINAMLGFAEEAQRNDRLLKIVLRYLRAAAFYADDVLDELSYEVLKARTERFHGIRRKLVRTFSLSCANTQIVRPADVAGLINEIMDELVLNEKKLELYYFKASPEAKLYQMPRKPQTNLLRGGRQISSTLVDESSVWVGRMI